MSYSRNEPTITLSSLVDLLFSKMSGSQQEMSFAARFLFDILGRVPPCDSYIYYERYALFVLAKWHIAYGLYIVEIYKHLNPDTRTKIRTAFSANGFVNTVLERLDPSDVTRNDLLTLTDSFFNGSTSTSDKDLFLKIYEFAELKFGKEYAEELAALYEKKETRWNSESDF